MQHTEIVVPKQDTLPYDLELSFLAAYHVQAQPYRCWRNAALAVHLLPELFADGGCYVEGWIVLPRPHHLAIIEHGWSQLADGTVVDPSILLVEQPSQPIFYYAGLTLSSEQMQEQLPGAVLPLVCHREYGRDGMQHAGYRQAYEQAWQQARILAAQQGLPETAIRCPLRDNDTVYVSVVVQERHG